MAETSEEIGRFAAAAEELAALARETVLAAYRFGIAHEIKDDGSPVTALDLAVERVLRARIEALFPEHGILGEEYGTVGAEREWLWVLDPIDGTKHFAAGLSDFGTLIALCRDGVPVIGVIDLPLLDRRCVGVAGRATRLNGREVRCRERRGLAECVLSSAGPDAFDGAPEAAFRRLRKSTAWNVYGGGCVGYASLAGGMVDICLEGNLDAFDFCALVPVIEGAGGVVSDWRGRPLRLDSGPLILAAGDRRVHEAALALLDQQGA
jgi:histidinol phosphatase-like enzyme (inositol monophosphatase family)